MTASSYAVAAAVVDALHAASMAAFFAGLPLLFLHRWPRLSSAYAVYAVTFVVLSQGSQLLLGNCFFTSIAGHLWGRAGFPVDAGEWFTVRAARFVFRSAPSHHVVSRIGDLAVLVTALGALVLLRARHVARSGPAISP